MSLPKFLRILPAIFFVLKPVSSSHQLDLKANDWNSGWGGSGRMRMQKPFGEVHHDPNICGGNAFLCGRKRVKESEIQGHSCGFPNSFDKRDEAETKWRWMQSLANRSLRLIPDNREKYRDFSDFLVEAPTEKPLYRPEFRTFIAARSR
jgi:hypothetical protein